MSDKGYPYTIVLILPFPAVRVPRDEWENHNSRVSIERREYPRAKVDISSSFDIFLGYPIWHSDAPTIVIRYLESVNLDGKTVVPFVTSGSSGIGESATRLKSNSSSQGTWLRGTRFRQGESDDNIRSWLIAIGAI